MMIDLVVPAREASLVGNLKVKRILPFRLRRMVGPFTFLDHMGPVELHPGPEGDVPPHPHIGLATVTYLFEGTLVHRDSLGTLQEINPGDVNWMTAGKGIVHSERKPLGQEGQTRRMEGLQAWVALPLATEECEPTFEHYGTAVLPQFEVDGVNIKLLAGEAFGRRSPVKTHSPLFYFEIKMPEGSSLTFEPGSQEAAVYVAQGELQAGEHSLAGPVLGVFKSGEKVVLKANQKTHAVLFGGDALEGPRYIWWNFVSSSKDRLENAKRDWREQKFPKVPDETEFTPLPEEKKAP
ncbi:MAG: pirin family protein [Bdellovibrionaceae bacterium]|nr:pirin family protein [Pseudobdellovibrionaceae bacterium]